MEVSIRGAVAGASDLLILGGGVTGKLSGALASLDQGARDLYERKCSTCHELRSPANRQMNPAQWESTVDRMIRNNNAPIGPDERTKIVDYLKAFAAAGNVTATVTVAADAAPGPRELRVVTPTGVSSAFPFVVTSLDESVEKEPNNDPAQAQPVTLPGAVNGVCQDNGDVDRYAFQAKAGQRLTLRVAAYALNRECQSFFNACLHLYDAEGKLLQRNLGFDNLDPLIDFKAPADGAYQVEVRDLLWRGGPGNVYRFEIGELGYHEAIYPLGAERGKSFDAVVFSDNQPQHTWRHTFAANSPLGILTVTTPFGPFRFQVSDVPDEFDKHDGQPHTVPMPSAINGWIGKPGEADRYLLEIDADEVHTATRWAVIGPFDGGADGFERPLGPEADLLAGRPVADRPFAGKGGDKTWEVKDVDGDGNLTFAAGDNEVWYALHAFESRNEVDQILSLGSDDGCRVWLNGVLVHSLRAYRPVRPADDQIPIHVRRGTNTLLVKVLNVGGPGGLTASAGAWSIEAFAQRLGSPLKPRVRLGFGTGWIADVSNGPGGDARLDWSFGKPGEYGLQIEDADGGGGERHAYRLLIQPARPETELEVLPGNPSVPQAGRLPLLVRRSALAGCKADLTLKLTDLPPGLHAEPVLLPADVDSAVISLEADAGAAAGYKVARLEVSAPGLPDDGWAKVWSLDHFRLQNSLFPIRRQGLVAAVVPGVAPYSVDVTPDTLAATPGSKAQLRVKLARRPGFGEDVTVTAYGAPSGVAVTAAVLRPNRDEATLEVTFQETLARGGFGSSSAADAYRFVVAGFAGGDGLTGGRMYSSAPIALQPAGPRQQQTTRTGQAPAAGAEPAGRAVMRRKCAACHAFYDPTQTRKTFPAWETTVDRMIQKNNAPVSAAEKAQILDYLKQLTAMQ
ncbi:MAG: pre-peptidase C-terminal domain-containing protein [Armatimonadetes bacterium]|nr:pre-peptidase C-terminal domain-containing protein [Armatimonadota bacterium]